jgi:glycosyltransferase involved in cell wall biosynthesis
MSFSYSVVIPYFNNADYIEETLQSIIANEFDITKIQVLLIDDGSTDNIKDIVNNVCDKYKTLHIEYHKKNNGN